MRHSFNQLLGVLWLTAIAELISKNYPQPKRATLPDVTPLPAGSPLQKLVSEKVQKINSVSEDGETLKGYTNS